MRRLAVVLLFALPLQAGTLCFVAAKEKPKCSAAEGPKITIAPADVERTFVFTSTDGKSVTAALAAAKSETIDLGDKSLRTISLAVRGSKARGWPADVNVILRDPKKHMWKWEIPRKRIETLIAIRVPAGQYAMTLTADHHVLEQRRVDVQRDVALKEVLLRALPEVHGRVTSTKEESISTATIATPDGKVIANVDEHGAFSAELGEPVPENVVVRAPGYGVTLVPLQPKDADNDLGTIRLQTGRKLTLRVVRPTGERFPVHVLVERELASRIAERMTVTERELDADSEVVTLPDLGEAGYFMTLRGKSPLEDLTLPVSIKDTDVEKTVKIEPFHIDIYAKLGNEALRDASLDFGAAEPLPLGADGHLSASAWQHGSWRGYLISKTIGGGHFVSSPELGGDPSRWDITFPARFLSGRILDGETRQPLPSVAFHLIVTEPSTHLKSYSSLSADENGRYSILAAAAGTYELTIQPPDYVAHKETLEVTDDSGSVEKDIVLDLGTSITIEAIWSNGAPVAGAQVLEGVASDGYNPARMWQLDGTGHLKVAVGRDEHRTLIILPSEGSFAIVHVEGGSNTDKPLRVVLPGPAGSLTVTMSDGNGKPRGAMLVMRFNGEPLPVSVVVRLPRPTGRGEPGASQFLQLPAGTYEIWGVDETGQPRSTVKTVAISAGPATVELTITGPR